MSFSVDLKTDNLNITPFLRWAGGKRWLTSSHANLFPETFEKYIEPFLGSGSVYFHLKPKKAVLSDLNEELINTYVAIKENWQQIYALLEAHSRLHCSEYYYQVRASTPVSDEAKAARFIYLNRTCWNGLYRVNGSGKFNVPIGTQRKALLDTDDFESLSKLFKGVDFQSQDFEKIIDKARSGDFIFVDPPYTVKHNYNGFIGYNEKIFHWNDQIRLSDCLKRASSRGCLIMLTNANHYSIKELYENDFEIKEVSRSSTIAGISSNRGVYEEVIIRNY
ncbi:MAG: Dam family site-specific DNA-(adenine-N6)-methyltransferase [Methylophilus sp.]|nr:Dam family site-specific DNA-(adenine-N6)-methyltransferase [Methylophilus sp.]